MKDVCVIVCYKRPEYLKICLEYIQKAEGASNLKYLFAYDLGGDDACLEIMRQFPFEKYMVRPTDLFRNIPVKMGKQSYNVLNGLLAASKMTDGLVYYVEDDVFVGKDFFTFTKAIHEKEPEIFETILSGNVNSKEEKVNDLNAYYVKENHNVHQGIGNCFKSEMIQKYIEPDFTIDYFKNPLLYVQKYYSDSKLNHYFCEQDGLIRRIIEKNKLKVAFSHVPRCFHAGLWGYNRYPKLQYQNLSIDEKVKLIKEINFDEKKLRQVVTAQNLADDSLPVNLETSHTDCIKI